MSIYYTPGSVQCPISTSQQFYEGHILTVTISFYGRGSRDSISSTRVWNMSPCQTPERYGHIYGNERGIVSPSPTLPIMTPTSSCPLLPSPSLCLSLSLCLCVCVCVCVHDSLSQYLSVSPSLSLSVFKDAMIMETPKRYLGGTCKNFRGLKLSKFMHKCV